MQSQADFFERIARLGREGQSFATATVVGRRAPVSAHLGDHAIVFADGRMEGFVGGACAREIVRTQAREALGAGMGRLVSIRPDAGDAGDAAAGRVVVPMTCASEGAVDVYIEPFVQAPLLVVVGATPIAGALARVARSLDYRVVRVVDDRERPDLAPEAAALGAGIAGLGALGEILQTRSGNDDRAVVVASQGHYDEEALETALKGGVPYVGLVASRARGATVRALLEGNGVPGVAALRNPAGLDLGARTPPEVALSILAEIVQARASRERAPAASMGTGDPPGRAERPPIAIDPVCKMQVDIATARDTAHVDGVTYYFCCAGCRARFVKQPHEYLPQAT